MSPANTQFSIAAHVMVAMASQANEVMTSSQLAESVNADPTFVRKLVAKLSKAGLIKATRGKGGACRLARPPDRITLLDIYRASGMLQAFSIHNYPVEKACPTSVCFKGLMADVLNEGQAALEESLGRQTLAGLAAGIKPNI